MAKKAAPKTRRKSTASDPDLSLVDEAYKAAFKQRVDSFFTTWITDQRQAESNLATGLAMLRDARDRALKIV